MKRQKPGNGIRAKIKFYYWCKSIGIDLKDFDPMNIDFSGPLKVSSFKKNPEATKAKYNHVFVPRPLQ